MTVPEHPGPRAGTGLGWKDRPRAKGRGAPSRGGPEMSGIQPDDDDRLHSEAPAEGEDEDQAQETERVHSEDPAEGSDEG